MSSLGTKVSKSRSPGASKVRATKAKKSPSKKPQRPGKITAAPKTKKASQAKEKKSIAAKSVAAKKVAPKKKVTKAAASKPAKKAPARVSPGKRVIARSKAVSRGARTRAATKPAPPPPRKQPAPSALAAVKAFEQALKLFNRHDYDSSKSAFEEILKKYGDHAEIAAGVRTYLAIVEQRMARIPPVPRNPDALYDQGVFEFNRGSFREAIDLFDKALKVEPRADHILYSLSAAYARLNDPSKALDFLRRAIAVRAVHRSHARRDPDFASLHTNEDFQQLTGFGFDLVDE